MRFCSMPETIIRHVLDPKGSEVWFEYASNSQTLSILFFKYQNYQL